MTLCDDCGEREAVTSVGFHQMCEPCFELFDRDYSEWLRERREEEAA